MVLARYGRIADRRRSLPPPPSRNQETAPRDQHDCQLNGVLLPLIPRRNTGGPINALRQHQSRHQAATPMAGTRDTQTYPQYRPPKLERTLHDDTSRPFEVRVGQQLDRQTTVESSTDDRTIHQRPTDVPKTTPSWTNYRVRISVDQTSERRA